MSKDMKEVFIVHSKETGKTICLSDKKKLIKSYIKMNKRYSRQTFIIDKEEMWIQDIDKLDDFILVPVEDMVLTKKELRIVEKDFDEFVYKMSDANYILRTMAISLNLGGKHKYIDVFNEASSAIKKVAKNDNTMDILKSGFIMQHILLNSNDNEYTSYMNVMEMNFNLDSEFREKIK